MCKIEDISDKSKNYKPKYEMQDIFRLYGDDYIARHKLNPMQLKAIRDISVCRTSAMGYNASECSDCKNIEFAYNSSRNRNCPKCQGDKRYDWILHSWGQTLVYHPHIHFVVAGGGIMGA